MTAAVTNLHRAAWATNALNTFVKDTWEVTSADKLTRDDLKDVISDLISDLLHLAFLKGHDPEALLENARSHFDAELVEE
jgi:hypothetical protein